MDLHINYGFCTTMDLHINCRYCNIPVAGRPLIVTLGNIHLSLPYGITSSVSVGFPILLGVVGGLCFKSLTKGVGCSLDSFNPFYLPQL
jgi:hypothetical protein